jgi:hypothetical protein
MLRTKLLDVVLKLSGLRHAVLLHARTSKTARQRYTKVFLIHLTINLKAIEIGTYICRLHYQRLSRSLFPKWYEHDLAAHIKLSSGGTRLDKTSYTIPRTWACESAMHPGSGVQSGYSYICRSRSATLNIIIWKEAAVRLAASDGSSGTLQFSKYEEATSCDHCTYSSSYPKFRA